VRVPGRPVPRLLASGVAGTLVVASLLVAPAPAAASYNPVTGSQGFGVFVQGNAALGQTSTVGPVAMGGNLTVGSNFTVAAM